MFSPNLWPSLCTKKADTVEILFSSGERREQVHSWKANPGRDISRAENRDTLQS